MTKKSISIKKRNNKKKNSRSIKNLKKIGGNSVGGLRRSITSRRRQNKRKTKKGGARPAIELSYGYEGEVDLKVSGTFSEGNVEDKPTSLIFSKGTREDPRPRVGLPGYHWGNFSSTPINRIFRNRICQRERNKIKNRWQPGPSEFGDEWEYFITDGESVNNISVRIDEKKRKELRNGELFIETAKRKIRFRPDPSGGGDAAREENINTILNYLGYDKCINYKACLSTGSGY
jgi:hypothetical protein